MLIFYPTAAIMWMATSALLLLVWTPRSLSSAMAFSPTLPVRTTTRTCCLSRWTSRWTTRAATGNHNHNHHQSSIHVHIGLQSLFSTSPVGSDDDMDSRSRSKTGTNKYMPIDVADTDIPTSSSDHAHHDSDSTYNNNNTNVLQASLDRLDLTPEQTLVVLERVKTMNAKQKNDSLNVELTIMWLENQLGLSKEQLKALVVGFPPLLGMSLEAKLIPTISFFDEALNGDDSGSCSTFRDHDEFKYDEHHQNNDRYLAVSLLLCDMPSLLEYNVRRRLEPRLERVRAVLDVSSVSTDILRIIATKTDSRFDEWLAQHESNTHKCGSIDGTNENEENGMDTRSESNTRDTEYTTRRYGEPCAYVIVSNLQSGSNIGNIVRSASIFGCEECLVVGQKRYRLTGDHGARFDLPRRHVYSHADARDYLQQKHGQDGRVRIYGVEIMANASPIMRYDHETGVMHFPFDRQWKGAAFIFGNEGQGLSEKQRDICDEFLFIPQTRGGSRMGGGSASMNVACAAAVVLQAYCTWAGYSDATLEGEKFLAQSSSIHSSIGE
jgi:tRNA G18 (ribose-2'-O)-methylase SpoU